MKLYIKSIDSCGICPNCVIIPAISSDVLSHGERRCRAVTYRHNVYRLIHWAVHEPYLPPWCALEDEVDPVI